MGVTVEGITFNGGDAYTRVVYRGVTLNKRTVAMLIRAQRIYGRPFNSLPQGSYNPGVGASGGTHDGGGAVDIFDSRLDDVQHVMRVVGFADWHRTLLPGVWNPHCHGIALGDKEASDTAKAQWPDYRNYLDGLAGHNPDTTWHPFPKGSDPEPIFDYEQWIKEQDMQPSDDAYPADDQNNTTWGDLWHRLDHLDEFRAAVGDRFDKTNASLGEAKDAIKSLAADLDGVHDQLAGVQLKLTAILDAVKNP
jgi:hypothetical protein